MAVGLIAAIAAAIAYAVGSVLQAVGAARTSKSGALDPRLLIRMIKQLPYLIGLAADGVGFLLGLVAIQFLPLFLSEALLASSVGITAVLAVVFLHVKLAAIEKWALVGLMVGLALLAISAKPDQAPPLAENWRWLELGFVVVVIAMALVAIKLPEGRIGVGLAIASGLGFSGMGIAARNLEIPDPIWEIIKDPSLYSVALYGILGLALFASALQRAGVTTVTALVFGIETVVPAIIGVAFLGDETRSGLWPVAAIGFLVALVCSTILARQAEPALEDDSSGELSTEPPS